MPQDHSPDLSLYEAARIMLLRHRTFVIPAVFARFPKPKESVLISEAKRIPVDEVRIALKYGDRVPFLILRSGDRTLWVTFISREKPGEEIVRRLARAKQSAIALDVSDYPCPMNEQSLAWLLFCDDGQAKTWLYNTVATRYFHLFYQNAEKLRMTAIGMKEYIVGCPLRIHQIDGRYYAQPKDDCEQCRFCISYYDDTHIWCSARRGIAYKSDFAKSESKRREILKKGIAQVQAQKEKERCPVCGGALVDCASDIGIVRRCTAYPDCAYVKHDPLFYVMLNREY